jgi:hypothetical protein
MEYQKSKESFKIRSWQINFVRKLRAVEFGKCNVCRNKSKILFEHDFTGLILALGVVHEGPRKAELCCRCTTAYINKFFYDAHITDGEPLTRVTPSRVAALYSTKRRKIVSVLKTIYKKVTDVNLH